MVGGQSTVEFGVRGRNVIAGERVRFGGHIEAEGDCRLDMWCDVAEDVLVGRDAYLGERVHVGGQLLVSGDLDIGDDVDIEEGFEANGWIVIRNPMPTIVFLFVYLTQLLRIGEEEAAADLLAEVGADASDHDPLIIPRGASVGDDAWRVSTPARIGDGCRIHGNVRAGSLTVGRDTVVFGSLRTKGEVIVGRGTEIKGDVTTRNGDVRVGPGTQVWGDIVADDVALHENATVEGKIRARGEMQMHTDAVLDVPDEDAAAMAEMAAELADDPDGEAPDENPADAGDDRTPADGGNGEQTATPDSSTDDEGGVDDEAADGESTDAEADNSTDAETDGESTDAETDGESTDAEADDSTDAEADDSTDADAAEVSD
ncbi:acyltransferase [Halobacteriales archaeon QS_1_68_17]|nr:MAG: acyltransferase [Halobacteriales archaeon QS_1_68_17]